jgi:hypothetical protein
MYFDHSYIAEVEFYFEIILYIILIYAASLLSLVQFFRNIAKFSLLLSKDANIFRIGINFVYY